MNNKRTLAKCIFFLFSFLPAQLVSAQDSASAIQLNQLGFYPGSPKIAVLTKASSASEFFVVKAGAADTVFKGKLGSEVPSRNSSLITRTADFSSLRNPGTYVLLIPGTGPSYAFNIKSNVLHEVAIASLKSYYFQRVSTPLDEAQAGKWKRAAGHPDTHVIIHASAASEKRPAGTVISTPGGWYDAGDYNKYIVNSGITMGTMMAAYEDFAGYYKQLKTGIPESANAVPDILDELLVNLRWMLTMQDPYDGGVYNKCTNAAFDGMVMPGITKEPRYVVQKGTAAALDFAAVTAQAARILTGFKAQLPGLADSCRKASIRAWEWAEANPDMQYNQDAINRTMTPKITTGGYGDRSYADEWFWAASELLTTTNDARYASVVKEHIAAPIKVPTWNQVHLLGVYTLLRKESGGHHGLQPMVGDAKKRLLSYADTLVANMYSSAFKTVMGRSKTEFNWGSNSNAANQGVLLINAFLLSGNKKYADAALSNTDYILGRNATGYCFVTGSGSKSPMHPHHRPSVADSVAEPVPGFLVGGPNPGKQDKCVYAFSEPETTYADVDCSYASNEIAINWNAPLVYLLNAVEALQSRVGY